MNNQINIETTYLLPKVIRFGFIIGSLTLVIIIPLLMGNRTSSLAYYISPLLFILMTVALYKKIQVDENIQPHFDPDSFEKLDTHQREEALDLYWAGPFKKAVKPRKPKLPSYLAWLLFEFMLIIIISFVIAANASEYNGLNTKHTFWFLILWVVAPLGIYFIYFNRAIKDELRYYSFKLDKYMDLLRMEHLQALVARWVNLHFNRWQGYAISEALNIARNRLDLQEADEFPLRNTQDISRGHVQERQPILVLLCGKFMALREGFVWLVKDSTYSIGVKGEAPVYTEEDVRELELNYQDIVTVTYIRGEPQPDSLSQFGKNFGKFKLTLTDAQSFEYDTYEEGAMSAVETIRKIVRKAKIMQ